MLRSLAQTAPSLVYGHVRDSLGEALAADIFERANAPRELDESSILVLLDATTRTPDAWPGFDAGHPRHAYLAMRLIGVRARTGDDWWVVFERAEGSSEQDARVRRFVHGVSGAGVVDDATDPLNIFEDVDERPDRPTSPVDVEGTVVVGPEGPITLSNEDVSHCLPTQMTAQGIPDRRFTLLARAYLERFPEAVFGSPELTIAQLGIEDVEVIVSALAWEHDVPGSTAFVSLATALVTRDPSAFRPGTPNTHWSQHPLSVRHRSSVAPRACSGSCCYGMR